MGTQILGTAANDASGVVSVSGDGTTVAIGAKFNNSAGYQHGQVRVLRFNGMDWIPRGLPIYGEEPNDQSGHSVSLNEDGSIVAIGAIENDALATSSGHVRVYQFNGTSWVQLGADIDGPGGTQDYFGWQVSLSADGLTLASSALDADVAGTNSGSVLIYHNNGASWVQMGSTLNGLDALDRFGSALSLSDDGTTVAAASNIQNAYLKVFGYDGTNWVPKGADIPGFANYDEYGTTLSLNADGTVIAASATEQMGFGTMAGKTYVHSFNGSSWVLLGGVINGEATNDHAGSATSISDDGSRVAIAAPLNDGNGTSSGHVRVFGFDGTAWGQVGQDIDGSLAGDGLRFASLNGGGSVVAVGSWDNDGNGNNAGQVRLFTTDCLPVFGTDVRTACATFTWLDGNTYASSTSVPTYSIVGGSSLGCDSVITLDLTIIDPAQHIDVQITCDPLTWLDGNTYVQSTTGPTFVYVGGSANGCDSVVSLDLTVLAPAQGIDQQEACGPITWLDGNTYSSNTFGPTYTLVGASYQGCDSIVTLDLTITPPAQGTDVQGACGPFTWLNGITYSASTVGPTHTLIGGSFQGCDSTVVLDLTVTTVDVSVTDASPVLTANATDATYQWLDCLNGNTLIDDETGASFTALVNGEYAVAVEQNGCVDTSACYAVLNTAVPTLIQGTNAITVHCNGSELVLSNPAQLEGEFIVADVTGRTLFRATIYRGTHQVFTMPLVNGAALWRFISADGTQCRGHLVCTR